MDVKSIVLKRHNELMREVGIDKESTIEMEMTRDYAIDSLGIVSLILNIEEDLDVELDDCLADIRRCKTIGEMISVIEAAVNEKE